MGKNTIKLYYPAKQSILSILPLVDEFVVAIGKGDADDPTLDEIKSIGSPKIKIIETEWDIEKYPRGMEHAHQTDIAMSHCTGDWLFYLQADEAVHEDDLPKIEQRCRELLDDRQVEALVFKYRHFWGDYDHYHNTHGWYRNEIRIVRNQADTHSWESAQSFRRIPGFDGLNYRQQEGTYKLKAARVDAWIYHYGWVRPPELMKNKMRVFAGNHRGQEQAEKDMQNIYQYFDYGPLDLLPVFEGTHPAVMQEWIAKFDWKSQLQYTGKPNPNRKLHRHEKWQTKWISFIENRLLGGRTIGGFNNYIMLKR